MNNVGLHILFEVDMLGDKSSVVREINSVGEGKLYALSWDFVGILLRNPEKLGDFTGEFS